MKKRDYKNLSKNSIYHIYNRGNNKEKIFYDDQDYRSFLYRIGLAIGITPDDLNKHNITKSPKSRVRITKSPANIFELHAFCLMPNHFHLLIEQCSDISLSTLMSKVCTSFAMYINRKYRRVGYLFQDRFKSVIIENDPQLMWTASYIHMNPVKDKIVLNPHDYQWSSYNDYLENRNIPIIQKGLITGIFGTKENLIKQTFVLSKKVSRTFLDTF